MKQLVYPNMNQTSAVGMCAEFVFKAFGSRSGWGFGYAHEAWVGQNPAHKYPGKRPPLGIITIIWHDYWAEILGIYRNWGHVSIHLADGRVLSSPYPNYGTGQRIFASIDEMERIIGLNYLGFTTALDGQQIADISVTLEPHQRIVDSPSGANRRSGPGTNFPVIGEPLAYDTYGDFDGWMHGERVNQGGVDSDIWIRGAISGHWFWIGSFQDMSTTGLSDLNPTVPDGPSERIVGPHGTNVRSSPNSTAKIYTSLSSGTKVRPVGWVIGENVDGLGDLWYKIDGGYAWAEGFTTSDKMGLDEFVTTDPVDPTPPENPEETFPTFSAFSPVVTRVYPAHKDNFYKQDFPKDQSQVVLHDFGTDGVNDFKSVLNWFRNPAAQTSAHFVVSGDEIVQMVSLDWRAYHAGAKGNGFVGIEIDPAVGRAPGDPLRDKTVKSVLRLLIALEEHYKTELTLRKHPEFAATSCGDDVDLVVFDLRREPDPGPAPTPEPSDLAEVLLKMNESLGLINATLQSQNRSFEIAHRIQNGT